MWKHWSIYSRSVIDTPSGGNKDILQPVVAELMPAQESSVPSGTVSEGTTDVTPLLTIAGTIAVVAKSSKSRLAPDTPTNLAAVAVSGGVVQEKVPVASSPQTVSSAENTAEVPTDADKLTLATPVTSFSKATSDAANTLPIPQQEQSPPLPRRVSFRSLAFFYRRDKPALMTSPVSQDLPSQPVSPKIKLWPSPKSKLLRSEKQALLAALALRTLIIGPSSVPMEDSASKGNSVQSNIQCAHSPDFKKVKSDLLKPTTANAVIAQLRRLPLPDGPLVNATGNASSQLLVVHPDGGGAPIHAVCLPCTDEEADRAYFSRLRASPDDALSPAQKDNKAPTSRSSGSPSVGTASLESLVSVLKDLHLVSLLTSPDLGFGLPVSEHDAGPLTGSVPSADVIIGGFEEITKQLMSLGFATSNAILPSHASIYPPEDRMSVLTYWWGLELVIPEPSIKFLGSVQSISHTVLNFLSAVSLFSSGVREVLPFIRYISNFVDFEWSAIKGQDKGRGVVCAATWVMPAAMVPRPWDFPSRPSPEPGTSKVPGATAPAPPDSAPAASTPPEKGGSGGKVSESPSPHPVVPPMVPYPPALISPMLPTLMVTPATLPRGAQSAQEQEVPT